MGCLDDGTIGPRGDRMSGGCTMGRWTMAKRNDGMDDGMMGRCDDGG